MTEKLSQERLEEISREPLTATNNDVLAMADELLDKRKYEIIIEVAPEPRTLN